MLWSRWTGFLDQMRKLRVKDGFIVIRRLKGAVYLVGRWERNSHLFMKPLPQEGAMIVLWDEK